MKIVLEPWNKAIVLHDTPYPGARAEVIRVWGRDRLRVLARLLPLLDACDVYLLGTGLPSFWVCRMGEMQLTLGLSGWTANDWTSGGSAIDQLAPPVEPSRRRDARRSPTRSARTPTWTLDALAAKTRASAPVVSAGLNKLALLGQVIHDLPHGVYRWRQVMPVTLSAELIGPENEETVAARADRSAGRSRSLATRPTRRVSGSVAAIVDGRAEAELTLDADDRIVGGQVRLFVLLHRRPAQRARAGTCRRIRNKVLGTVRGTNTVEGWFKRFAF